MDITKSLCCRRLSFTNAASCPHCGKLFQTGTLTAKAVAEEKSSARNAHLLFFTALVTVPALLFFLQFQGFLHGALKSDR